MPNLVVQTAFLGDLFLSIPLLKQIKREYPNEPIFLFCRKGFGSVFKQLKLIDDFVEVDKTDKDSWKTSFQHLKGIEFENIFCPHESVRSAIMVKRLKATHKIGFANWWNFFTFNERVMKFQAWPEALRQLTLLSSKSEIVKSSLDDLKEKKFFLNQNTKRELHRVIPVFASMNIKDRLPNKSDVWGQVKKEQNYVCVAPGSIWETKKWPSENYHELCKKLSEQGYKIVIVGSSEEADLGDSVITGMSGAVNLCGKTDLIGSLQVLAHAKFLVSNDSGSQHLAAAVGTPTVSIFGPTTLSLGYRPWQNKVEISEVIMSCRPCGKHGAKKCPIGTHACMKQIEPDHVLKNVLRVIKDPSH